MAILIKGAHMPPEGFCKDLLVYSTGRVEQYDARANLVHTYRDAASEVPDKQLDDTVSRQAAIDVIIDEFKRIPTNAIRAKTRIEALPSA